MAVFGQMKKGDLEIKEGRVESQTCMPDVFYHIKSRNPQKNRRFYFEDKMHARAFRGGKAKDKTYTMGNFASLVSRQCACVDLAKANPIVSYFSNDPPYL